MEATPEQVAWTRGYDAARATYQNTPSLAAISSQPAYRVTHTGGTVPQLGPDASGLIFLPVLPDDLETILEALGTAAGSAADRDGPAAWEPFAALQTKLAGYRPR